MADYYSRGMMPQADASSSGGGGGRGGGGISLGVSSGRSGGSSTSSSRSAGASSSSGESESGSAWSKEQLDRIGQLFPQLLGEYTGYNTQTPYSSLLSEIGGPQSPFPTITRGPIWNENQVQSRVNQMRSGNDLAAGGAVRGLGESTAGRGFGASSPLLQELTSNIGSQNRATNTQGENDLRWNAAQGNAQHRLAAEQADVGRSTAMSQDDLQRRQMALSGRGQDLQYAANRQNALLQALAYYNQPLPFAKSKNKSDSWHASTSESNSSNSSEQGSSNASANWF